MEKRLFSWKSRRFRFDGYLYFDCVLKVPIGEYLIGTKIDAINIANGKIYLTKGVYTIWYNLELTVSQ